MILNYICATKCISLSKSIQQFCKLDTATTCLSIFNFLSFYNSQSSSGEAYGHIYFENANASLTNINISQTSAEIDLFFKSVNSPSLKVSYFNAHKNKISNRNGIVVAYSDLNLISKSNFVDNQVKTGNEISGLFFISGAHININQCCIIGNIISGENYYVYIYNGTVDFGSNFLQPGLYSTVNPPNDLNSDTIELKLYESYECRAMNPFKLRKKQCNSNQKMSNFASLNVVTYFLSLCEYCLPSPHCKVVGYKLI